MKKQKTNLSNVIAHSLGKNQVQYPPVDMKAVSAVLAALRSKDVINLDDLRNIRKFIHQYRTLHAVMEEVVKRPLNVSGDKAEANKCRVMAAQCLIRALRNGTKCLETTEDDLVRVLASKLDSIPLIVPANPSARKSISKKISKLGVGSSHEETGARASSRLKHDVFSQLAATITSEGEYDFDFATFPVPSIRKLVKSVVGDMDGKNVKELEEKIASPSDKTAGRKRSRLIETLVQRILSLFGRNTTKASQDCTGT